MKVEIKAAGVERYMIDTIKLSDRLNDIAGWIDVVHLAIEGAAAELDTPLLGPVMTFVSESRAQIAAVSDEICPGPTPPMAAAEGEQAGVAACVPVRPAAASWLVPQPFPAAVALPAMALAASTGDAELIDLCRQCLDASGAVADADALARAASRAYEAARPERPDTLRITEIDRGYWDNLSKLDDGFPNSGYFGAADVQGIRNHNRKNLTAVKSYPPEHPLALQPIPKGEPTGKFPVDHVLVFRGNGEWSQEQCARADEVVAAWDRWNAADEGVNLRCGLTAGEEGEAAAWHARDEIASAIAERPAVTAAGLKAKAAVILPEERGGGDADEAIMESLIADLLALGNAVS